MLITEILARNARVYGDETALVERDPAQNKRAAITWQAFDDRANQIAQALLADGIGKGKCVAHLMTNCLDWLPVYFGILRTGALVAPLNFRFVAKTIHRCVSTAKAQVLIFGPEFIDRIADVKDRLDPFVKTYIFTGQPHATARLRPPYRRLYKGVSMHPTAG